MMSKKDIIKLYEFIENQLIEQNINNYDGEKLLIKVDYLYYDFQNGLDSKILKTKFNNILKQFNKLKNN